VAHRRKDDRARVDDRAVEIEEEDRVAHPARGSMGIGVRVGMGQTKRIGRGERRA
jgi:hypothetical protein